MQTDTQEISQEAARAMLAALRRIDAINGSTGGHKAMVNEFKWLARTALDVAEAR